MNLLHAYNMSTQRSFIRVYVHEYSEIKKYSEYVDLMGTNNIYW